MYTVDASVWVNAFDQREPGYLLNRQFLEVVRDHALSIFVPNVVLVEVAGAISRAIPGTPYSILFGGHLKAKVPPRQYSGADPLPAAL